MTGTTGRPRAAVPRGSARRRRRPSAPRSPSMGPGSSTSRPGCPSSTTWSSSWAARLVRPHAAGRATCTSTPTTPSRTSGSCSGAAWPRRWATSGASAVLRRCCCRSMKPDRGRARPQRRPFLAYDWRSPPTRSGSARRRSTRSWRGFWRAFATAGNLTLHIGAGRARTRTTFWRRASRAWPGACATPSG